MPVPLVLDLYHGDVVTSWESIYDSGIRGVIHKASQGSSIVDKKYADRKPQAQRAGLLWGAYHFGDGSDVDSQINNFLSVVGDAKDTLLALDFEPNTKGASMSLAQAKYFLQKIEEKTGQIPALYSGHFIKEKLQNVSGLFWGKYKLWLCQYANTPVLPAAWEKYWLWQYTGDGVGPKPHSIAGIQGDVDLNVFNGTEGELKMSWLTYGSPTVNVPVETTKDLPWIEIAKGLVGIEETPGTKNNATIMSWAKVLGMTDYNADSIPWCGLFVAHVLSQAGMDVTDAPLWALSWKHWGNKLDEPAYGALLVFKREGGGHVGFYMSEDSDYYHVLGGNQSDSVCVTKVAKDRCVAIRWPADHMDLLIKGKIVKQFDGKVTTNEK